MNTNTPSSEYRPSGNYVPSTDSAAMWDTDLTEQQQRWMPATADDLWEYVLPWRCERTVQRLDDREVDVIRLTEGAGPSWDWRTVAYWTAMLARPGGFTFATAPVATSSRHGRTRRPDLTTRLSPR